MSNDSGVSASGLPFTRENNPLDSTLENEKKVENEIQNKIEDLHPKEMINFGASDTNKKGVNARPVTGDQCSDKITRISQNLNIADNQAKKIHTTPPPKVDKSISIIQQNTLESFSDLSDVKKDLAQHEKLVSDKSAYHTLNSCIFPLKLILKQIQAQKKASTEKQDESAAEKWGLLEKNCKETSENS